MKDIIRMFKGGLSLIPSHLLRFIKKAFCAIWIYAYTSVIPMVLAFVVMELVKTFTTNTNAAIIVFKILAIICQIIPLSSSLYISECELINTEEDSAELCFAICVSVIVAIWLK